MVYIIVAIILILTEFAYFKIAAHYKIIDKPNTRSSHDYITIRGGGIVFPIAIILFSLFFDYPYIWAITGLMIISVISLLDDFYSLSRMLRMIIHFMAVSLLFIHFSFFLFPWYYWVTAYIVFVGWINAFNFMDGINGITSFYSLVCLATFLFLLRELNFVSFEMLIILILSVLVFSIFNVRKRAKAFAGDVGSVSMAYILAWIMFGLIIYTQRFEYILFFSVYAVDSIFTIMYRLLRFENISKPHRCHLYQYLSNELELPHVTVSAIYAGTQLIINISVIFLFRTGIMSMNVFISFCIIISILYLLVRHYILKRI